MQAGTCAEANPMQRGYKSENKDLPSMSLPATAGGQLCHHKMAASSGCPCPSTEGEPGPLSSQVLSQPHKPLSIPCHHPGQRLSLRGAAQGAHSQGQHTELTSSPSSSFTPSTGVAELRSPPHSFILTSNRLCFVLVWFLFA